MEEVETISDKGAWRIRLSDTWELKIYLTHSGEYKAAVGYDTNSLAHYSDAVQYLAREKGFAKTYPNSYNAENFGNFWVYDSMIAKKLEECKKCCQ